MNLRLATNDDLSVIKEMYKGLIIKIKEDGIQIWNDVYPYEFLADDIIKKRLYILSNKKVILGAFALCESNDG